MVKMQLGKALLVCVIVFTCLVFVTLGATLLPESEVEGLKEIAKTLGKKNWNFSVDPCSGESGWVAPKSTSGVENVVTCNCSYVNNTVCHVVSVVLKSQSLPGVLPPELLKLPYLQQLDLTRNYLNGSIPKEWGSMQLINISLNANRLMGGVPVEIANIATLRSLALEYNHFYGVLPPELGNMASIERLLLTSNNFTGHLPETLAKLTTLKDFRISDNQFSGKIPSFIQRWTNLERIAMQASGLEGPIPSGISLLSTITDMRFSDINGADIAFPLLNNMSNMRTLVLRSCNIIGEIPAYLGDMVGLKTLDLSFNKLTGEIPSNFESLINTDFIYLTGNALNGSVPEKMLKQGDHVDLSYNNFILESSESPNCQQRNVNLFGSSFKGNNSSGVVPCLKSFQCKRNSYSLHINCGGEEFIFSGSITYEADMHPADASRFFLSANNWAFSSTGNFLDNNNDVDNYIATNTSGLAMREHQLYMTARLSPLSLTYYALCMLNGNYTVSLHFAEIVFTNDKTYSSLGRRIFDIYIQGKLLLKDFNIEDEAGGVGKVVIKKFPAIVAGTTIEIRFYWAGKGTIGIPSYGTYGPLVSAITIDPDFEPPIEDGKKISPGTVAAIMLLVFCFVGMVLGVLWWKGCFERKYDTFQDLRDLNPQTGSFTLRQIKHATNNFGAENKIGEGGLGPVYKGYLSDGTVIADKQLSSKSKQGNVNFLMRSK